MKNQSLIGSKALLAICNLFLLICGCILVTGGLLTLFDSERILLSRLLSAGSLSTMTHPLLYYLSLGISVLGLTLTGIGVLGCWTSCLYSYFMLTIYFLLVVLILVVECAIYAITWIWPHCLGLEINSIELIRNLQRNYGVSGQEQFTAAIDLAQYLFNCCGILSANEYDTSLWRLQALGPKLVIPLTCCLLENSKDSKAYLDPQPLNTSLCQALEPMRFEGFRYKKGCMDNLEGWYKEQYIIFLGAGLVIVLVEFAVLLSTILAFANVCRHKQVPIERVNRENTYGYSNETYTTNYKLERPN